MWNWHGCAMNLMILPEVESVAWHGMEREMMYMIGMM
jgi:hypothetical protein